MTRDRSYLVSGPSSFSLATVLVSHSCFACYGDQHANLSVDRIAFIGILSLARIDYLVNAKRDSWRERAFVLLVHDPLKGSSTRLARAIQEYLGKTHRTEFN